MRPALLVCIAVSCASPRPQPVPTPVTPAAAPARLTADQIMERMRAAYTNARTYSDRGTSTTVFTPPGKKQTTTFTTAFDRAGGRFRFEYRDGGSADRAHIIWLEQGMSYATWFLKPGVVDADPDMMMPISAAAGVSEGLSAMILPMLFDAQRAYFSRTTLALTGEATVGGRACWQLDGTENDESMQVLVDRETYLVRRVVLRRHFDDSRDTKAFDVAQTIELEPQLDGAIADAELRGPDRTGLKENKRDAPKWVGLLFETDTNRVREVLPTSPAARAGLQPGDEIVLLAGAPVSSVADVVREVQAHAPGDVIEVEVKRGGTTMKVSVTIEYRPNVEKIQQNKLLDKPSPGFSLATLAGGTVKLADLKGKIVVIDFWASWCKPCIGSFPTFKQWHTTLGKKGVVVVGITDDDLDAVKVTVAEHKLPYTIALDSKREAWRDFLVQGLPTTVVVDKAGVVRYVTVGAGEEKAIEAVLAKLMK